MSKCHDLSQETLWTLLQREFSNFPFHIFPLTLALVVRAGSGARCIGRTEMVVELLNEEAIFKVAVEIPAEAARSTYLQQVCGNDQALFDRVLALLRVSSEAKDFLESPPAGSGPPTVDSAVTEQPGTLIGPYKLLQQIGEGGMGVVFMAEQTEPIQRTVALKIIKPGMDTRQVIARFEAERQAVAMMDHPNIAKVLDAGTTESGRPYFVMELVKGVPITKYCDDKHLPIRERLHLFMQVCQAVQHAHQKGIIHRDIKPNNVLVAEYDDHAIPKVIDFGVAKATAQKLTERTMFTEFGQVLGTMEYMSPEQSKFNQLDIDTRSDIYSLGVLLYELLAGSTPFEGKRLKEAAFDEMLRIIREEDPPKPSTRLSSSDTLPSIAANRHIEPARLSKDVRGDLDWIVMKAMEKDRNRRYETASGFAADIERHLHDDPVEAGRPSAAYRFRKFSKRNKAALVAGSVVAAALFLGLIGTTWQAIRATGAERVAKEESNRASREAERAKSEAANAQAVNDFLNRDLFGQTDPHVPYDRYDQPRAELRLAPVLERAAGQLEGRFADQPLVEATLQHTIGHTYLRLIFDDDMSPAVLHLQRAVELRRVHLGEEHPDTLSSMGYLAWAKSDPDLVRRVLEIRQRVLGKDHRDTLHSMFTLAMVTRKKDKKNAIALFRSTVEAARKALGEDDRFTAYAMHCLAATMNAAADAAGHSEAEDREIESMYRHALAVYRKQFGEIWNTYDITKGLASFLIAHHRYEEAEALLQDAYTRLNSLPGAPAELILSFANALDGLYRDWGNPEKTAKWKPQRHAAAEAALSRNAQLLIDRLDDPVLLRSHGHLLFSLHRYGQAEAAYRAAATLRPDNPWFHQSVGDACAAQRRFAEAEIAYREAIRLEPKEGGRHHNLADALLALGKSEEAAAEYAEADKWLKTIDKKPTTKPSVEVK
jgi:serine/threonine protein kinase/tetratricopeptide (TPR) repeat protein